VAAAPVGATARRHRRAAASGSSAGRSVAGARPAPAGGGSSSVCRCRQGSAGEGGVRADAGREPAARGFSTRFGGGRGVFSGLSSEVRLYAGAAGAAGWGKDFARRWAKRAAACSSCRSRCANLVARVTSCRWAMPARLLGVEGRGGDRSRGARARRGSLQKPALGAADRGGWLRRWTRGDRSRPRRPACGAAVERRRPRDPRAESWSGAFGTKVRLAQKDARRAGKTRRFRLPLARPARFDPRQAFCASN